VSDLESAYIPYLNGQMAQPVPDDGKPHVWAQKGFQFHDLLDIINPLQHLPGISAIYRWITGESIGNLPRVVGDAIYGGIPGFVSGLFGVLLKEETGKDVGEHIVATLFGDSSKATTPQYAELTTEQASALIHAPVETTALAPLPGATAATPAEPPTNSSQPIPATKSPPPQVLADTPSIAAAPTAPPPPTVAAVPVVPDHAPIPLERGIGMAASAPMPVATSIASTPASSAAQAFLAQAAERKRQFFGSSGPTDAGRILNPQPVPLQLPPGALGLNARQRGVLLSAAASATQPASKDPIDLSQKMADALDKYIALQKQNTSARGSQLDLNP